ncbi:hypothetical protein, partial [Roseateles chitosanitabidus]|uniref:hypothetical protein n=1 Tax=Roseateles chitosanitabidus TaxID=65048 RepID=UPI001C3FE7FD
MNASTPSQSKSSGAGAESARKINGVVVDPTRRGVKRPHENDVEKSSMQDGPTAKVTRPNENDDSEGAVALSTSSSGDAAAVVDSAASSTATSVSASSVAASGLSLTTVGLGALGVVGVAAAAGGGGGGSDAKASPNAEMPQTPQTPQTPQAPGASSGGDSPVPPVKVPDSGGAPINGQGQVPISGVSPDAEWEYSLDGGKTWHQGHGAGVPASELAEGNNSITVVQTDKSGHRSEPVVVEV